VALVFLQLRAGKANTMTNAYSKKGRLRLSEFACQLRQELIRDGVHPEHPMLAYDFSRKIRSMTGDGLLEHVRINNQFYFDPAYVRAAVAALKPRLNKPLS
jgi:hypothetical protein